MTPPGFPKKGEVEMAFRVLRRREGALSRCWRWGVLGRLREEAGELTLTSPLCHLTFIRNPSFLPMTFMAKEANGTWEREAGRTSPSEGHSSGAKHPGSKPGSSVKPQASHYPL